MTTTTAQATQVYQLFIKATPERIWEAITRPEFTTKYFHGSYVDSTFEPGAAYNGYSTDRSQQWVDGEVLEADPPRRLQHTWRSLYDPEAAAEPHSRVTWEIEPQQDGTCLVTVVHDKLEESPKTAESVSGTGWIAVLSGLKTLLETGQPLAE
ncbi:MAG TPA: SRPBCC family protein [Solirubrobacteraceae bacterium]|nr:SRPBCC family protein [Solirubrobacteraceae bacterium]